MDALLVVAGGGMNKPTAFAPFSCISLKKLHEGGYNAARGIISRDITPFL